LYVDYNIKLYRRAPIVIIPTFPPHSVWLSFRRGRAKRDCHHFDVNYTFTRERRPRCRHN